jgi:dephospho-CoA kinase
MKTIGLTGGIGSGKSVVARIFETMDIPVYNSDKEAKRVTSESEFIRDALLKRFGWEIYPDGILNKTLLASLIFGKKKTLNLSIQSSIRKYKKTLSDGGRSIKINIW